MTNGKIGFRGELRVKVARVNPTLWQRFLDRLRGIA